MADNTDNLGLWNKLGKTDPSHTKPFTRGGGFKGTAIKPIYTEHKMTEQFGPCGTGWGMGEPSFQLVTVGDEILVYCTVNLWYVVEAERPPAYVWGVGGDKVAAKYSSGLKADDEAFKKAFTDAIGNAMKHLGMSADVHMGLFDDSKYVSARREEEAAGPEGESIMDYTKGNGGRQTKLEATGKKSSYQAKKDKDWEWADEALRDATSLDQLREWYKANRERLEQFPENWRDEFQAKLDGRVSELKVLEQNIMAGG